MAPVLSLAGQSQSRIIDSSDAVKNPSRTRSTPPVDAVIWDYDGTLVDTRGADEAAVAELVAGDPGAAAGAEVFWAAEGRPILERLEMAWPGRADEVLPLFDRRVSPNTFRGIPGVLAALGRRRLRLAVVSSRRLEPLEWGLQACGLSGHFETVVGLDCVSRPKPDPEGLLLACRRLGVRPIRAVYIGDRDVDVDAGRHCGMMVWRATWALPPSAGAAAPNPREVASPAEVLHRLDGHIAETG
ncbi:MAG: pyrophosphatase PpaX [Chloroflexota bacterium]|nr:pyrophosphatase PpaX [Chloroflexota bacterium]